MPGRERILLLSCSQKKRTDEGELPALQRYDGPLFRVLRKYIQTSSEGHTKPAIYILSAEFGWLFAEQPIRWYDRRLTRKRIAELRPGVEKAFGDLWLEHQASEVFFCGGQSYLHLLGEYQHLLPEGVSMKIASGSMGRLQAALFDWLHGSTPMASQSVRHQTQDPVELMLRGQTFVWTYDEVLSRAQKALEEGKGRPSQYESWYVNIRGQNVSPKWLVSILTELPVSAFHTGDARRVLEKVGVRVERAVSFASPFATK